jgi:hypothetical protein
MDRFARLVMPSRSNLAREQLVRSANFLSSPPAGQPRPVLKTENGKWNTRKPLPKLSSFGQNHAPLRRHYIVFYRTFYGELVDHHLRPHFRRLNQTKSNQIKPNQTKSGQKAHAAPANAQAQTSNPEL